MYIAVKQYNKYKNNISYEIYKLNLQQHENHKYIVLVDFQRLFVNKNKLFVANYQSIRKHNYLFL